MKKAVGYVFSRPIKGSRVPQRVQNLVIRDFCANKEFELLLSRVEYVNEDGFSVFMSLRNELSKQTVVVMYSLFQLPKKQEIRYAIYDFISKRCSQIWFALEGLCIESQSEVNLIEHVLEIQNCLGHPSYNQNLINIRNWYEV